MGFWDDIRRNYTPEPGDEWNTVDEISLNLQLYRDVKDPKYLMQAQKDARKIGFPLPCVGLHMPCSQNSDCCSGNCDGICYPHP